VTIVLFSLACEALVSALLVARLWIAGNSVGEALWEGGFHGVSAFNNAGFSLYSENSSGSPPTAGSWSRSPGQ
jgi:Trk-type K+ transport system membrane component